MTWTRANTKKRISKEWNKKLRPSKLSKDLTEDVDAAKSMSVQKAKAEPMKTVIQVIPKASSMDSVVKSAVMTPMKTP